MEHRFCCCHRNCAPVNDSPIAVSDSSETDENVSVRIDILANDSDPDGNLNASSVNILQQPAHGSLDIDPSTGVTTYYPSNGHCGSDTFSYVVEDNEGEGSNEATVDIQIRCNQPPSAHNDYATTDENTAIEINVVSNDEDSDGSLDVSSIVITTLHPSGLSEFTPQVAS